MNVLKREELLTVIAMSPYVMWWVAVSCVAVGLAMSTRVSATIPFECESNMTEVVQLTAAKATGEYL